MNIVTEGMQIEEQRKVGEVGLQLEALEQALTLVNGSVEDIINDIVPILSDGIAYPASDEQDSERLCDTAHRIRISVDKIDEIRLFIDRARSRIEL